MSGQNRNTPNAPAFVEDLFIVDWNEDKTKKVVYHVPEKVWKCLPQLAESDVSNATVAQLLPLLRSEVVIADVPGSKDREACYLTDLTALAVNVD
jgi:hypothetical protein